MLFFCRGQWAITLASRFIDELQKRVLFEALDLLVTAQISGIIRDIPIKWADVRREAKTLTEQGRRL